MCYPSATPQSQGLPKPVRAWARKERKHEQGNAIGGPYKV